MLHTTKAIVLRSVKYGETSLVVTMYTELFGLQSYLINGARTEKRSSVKANMYQPTTLLDLIVYHQPNKNLQRIREARLFGSNNFQGAEVVRYTIGIYMVELIQKAITESETNPELYDFFEQSFLHVLREKESVLSNYPLVFTLLFADHLGFGIYNNYTDETPFFNLNSGNFVAEHDSIFNLRIEKEDSFIISNIMKSDDNKTSLSGQKRMEILTICIQYLRLHIPHLGELKSVPVLHEILN